MEFCKHFKALPNGRRITVGAIYEDGTMTFGVSVCKPGEPFCKKLGHAKAVGKARSKNQHAGQVTVPSSERQPIGPYFRTMAQHVMNMKNEELTLRETAEKQLA